MGCTTEMKCAWFNTKILPEPEQSLALEPMGTSLWRAWAEEQRTNYGCSGSDLLSENVNAVDEIHMDLSGSTSDEILLAAHCNRSYVTPISSCARQPAGKKLQPGAIRITIKNNTEKQTNNALYPLLIEEENAPAKSFRIRSTGGQGATVDGTSSVMYASSVDHDVYLLLQETSTIIQQQAAIWEDIQSKSRIGPQSACGSGQGGQATTESSDCSHLTPKNNGAAAPANQRYYDIVNATSTKCSATRDPLQDLWYNQIINQHKLRAEGDGRTPKIAHSQHHLAKEDLDACDAVLVQCVGCNVKLSAIIDEPIFCCPECGTLSSFSLAKKLAGRYHWNFKEGFS